MPGQRYAVNHQPVSILLAWIKEGVIAVPEIQRPFVWTPAKVRDFVDSLYRGYPVGYLISWQNPDVRLKDGTRSQGKRILIDGQQRMAALLAALLGEEVMNKDYRKQRIFIAFHPKEERFEVANAAIRKNPAWIADIATVFEPNVDMLAFLDRYCEANPDVNRNEAWNSINRLSNVQNNDLGIVDLHPDLDVETVAEIFVRVNLGGVPLGASDFAMSKMAANEQHDGHLLRKCIDYFCHLAIAPEAYTVLAQDSDFASTDYFSKMWWLRNGKDDIYNPSYTDMLRVAFTSEFKRGPLDDLVALLSGRNFETRAYEEEIAEDTFQRLASGISRFMTEDNFRKFVMILRSAGFVDASLVRSQNTVNFAYILYLTMRARGDSPARIESTVRRWFVMSVLTGRYASAAETTFGADITNIASQGASEYLASVESAELSDAFWNVGLPLNMHTSSAGSPYFSAFRASQAKGNDLGFLSSDITVQNLLEGQSHIHHVFPKGYLGKHGFKPGRYNQIANYVLMQSEINIAIGDKPPHVYFAELWEQCRTGDAKYGGITDTDQLRENLAAHCIPEGMEQRDVGGYDGFLDERRRLMAAKLRDYYAKL